jgi:uncharacterized protein YecE (DUF72 family)
VSAVIRIGTCSFADEALVKAWYPHGIRSGAERLRYYAERFDTVEIDSTYYSLPSPEAVARWAEATPSGFVFHVKAFALMTRHPVRAEQLPADVRAATSPDEHGRVDRVPREVRAEVFARFHAALEPLRAAAKLGGILMQFPPYVVPRPASFEYLEWGQAQLRGDEMLVEFRHRDWLDEANRAELFSFLEERGMTYVAVDSPRTGGKNVLPTLVTATTSTAYIRMHGRNAKTWNVRGRGAAERFDHLYSEAELEEWVSPLRELASETERAYVLFNTNNRSPDRAQVRDLQLPTLEDERQDEWIAQGPANAEMLRRLLRASGLPVSDPSGI